MTTSWATTLNFTIRTRENCTISITDIVGDSTQICIPSITCNPIPIRTFIPLKCTSSIKVQHSTISSNTRVYTTIVSEANKTELLRLAMTPILEHINLLNSTIMRKYVSNLILSTVFFGSSNKQFTGTNFIFRCLVLWNDTFGV